MAYQNEMRLKQYETVVVDFVAKHKGHFITFSDDHTFLSILRSTLVKDLAIQDDCLTSVQNPDKIVKTVADVNKLRQNVLVFLERRFQDSDMGPIVKQLKNAFPKAKVIVLTGEIEKERLVLLHEIGADNFISKPISINNLIEKIAFTVQPQGKIGKIIEMGKKCLEQGEYEKALQVSHKVLEIKPNSAAGFLIRGDAFFAMAKHDRAVEAYEEAATHAPVFMDPIKRLVSFYRDQKDHESELFYLEKLDKLSPLNVDRKVDMGSIHVDLGNSEEAESLFQLAVKQSSRDAAEQLGDVTTRIGDIYNKKDPTKAEEYYRRSIEVKKDALTKKDVRIFNQLGIALRRQGKWKDALLEYKRALEISPDDENLYYNMALALAEGKQHKSAAEHLRKALAISDEFYKQSAVIAYNVGSIMAQAEHADATHYLETALKLDPNMKSAKSLFLAIKRKKN